MEPTTVGPAGQCISIAVAGTAAAAIWLRDNDRQGTVVLLIVTLVNTVNLLEEGLECLIRHQNTFLNLQPLPFI